MSDDVPAAEKLAPLNDLLALQKSIAATKTARWSGRNVQVLVEATIAGARLRSHPARQAFDLLKGGDYCAR